MPDITKIHTIADNFRVRVVADHKEQLLAAMLLAFNGRSASHYAISPYWGMIFFDYVGDYEKKSKTHTTWLENDYVHAPQQTTDGDTLYKMETVCFTEEYEIKGMPGGKTGILKCAEMAWDWVKTAEYKTFAGNELEDMSLAEKAQADPHGFIDDYDVSTYKGFEVSTGDIWNHVGPHHGSICHVRPHWIWCGK